ncbi:hypothetical protein Tco_0438258 [Tanacetum coccineum]
MESEVIATTIDELQEVTSTTIIADQPLVGLQLHPPGLLLVTREPKSSFYSVIPEHVIICVSGGGCKAVEMRGLRIVVVEDEGVLIGRTEARALAGQSHRVYDCSHVGHLIAVSMEYPLRPPFFTLNLFKAAATET